MYLDADISVKKKRYQKLLGGAVVSLVPETKGDGDRSGGKPGESRNACSTDLS